MSVPAPHLVHVFPGFDSGGPQLRTARLIDHFGRRYRHTILALDRRTSARALLDAGLDVGVIGAPEAAGPARVLRLGAWIALLRPDLVLTYGEGAITAALATRWRRIAPLVHHENGVGPGGWSRAPLRHLALPAAARVVVTSPSLEARLARGWGLRPLRLVCIPCGVETGSGRATAAAPIPGFERRPGELVIGSVSSMRDLGDVLRLLGALARVAEARAARLVVFGDGPRRGDLVEAIVGQGLEGQVLLTGAVPDPGRCFPELDLFAVAGERERRPYDAIEAMAAGLPLIGTDQGDLRQMVGTPNRAFIVDPGNAVALAARLDALLRDAQLRARLGRANRAKAEAEFSFSAMAEAYGRLYEELLARRPAARDP